MKSFLTILSFAVALQAQVKLPPFTKQVLTNGVTLILSPNAELPLTNFRVLIRGGADADPVGKGGLAAITSELIRRGTATRTAAAISESLDAMGATLVTRADRSAITVDLECLSKDTSAALDILADILLHPTFTQEEVNKALTQALDSSRAIKDNPRMITGSYFNGFFYPPGHPYRQRPEGDEVSLAKLDRDAIVEFHRRQFTGKNLIILAGGSFQSANMQAKLAGMFLTVQAGETFPWAAPPELKRGEAPRLLLIDKPDATQTYFMIGQPGLKRGDADEVPVTLINTLFGGRFTSMLNDELRVNSGLTYGANSTVNLNRLQGAITISTFTKTETTGKAIDVALTILKKLNQQGITAEQLKSVKTYVKGTYPPQHLETADQVASVLGDIELYGLNRGEVDDLFSKVDAVTLERANSAARKYFQPGNLVFVLIGKASEIRDTAKKYSSQVVESTIAQPGFWAE